jgi:hypothetical protein
MKLDRARVSPFAGSGSHIRHKYAVAWYPKSQTNYGASSGPSYRGRARLNPVQEKGGHDGRSVEGIGEG